MEILGEIADSLEQGDHERTVDLVGQAMRGGTPVADILNVGLIAGMNVVGEKFREHEIFLPDVLLAAKAMTAALELLKPALIKDKVPSRGKVVIGSAQGDLHDIGKNLVGIMLQGAGFEVVDLGNDVPPERFVEVAIDEQASVIGMSALLTTTMASMNSVVALIRDRTDAAHVKTIVGGAPVSREFAQEIGADDYGYDAANAVERVKALLGAD